MYRQIGMPMEDTPWRNVLMTTVDANQRLAPVVQPAQYMSDTVLNATYALATEIWAATKPLTRLRTIANGRACQLLIGQHRFSTNAKRPLGLGTAEWVVLITAQPQRPQSIDTGERIDVALARFAPHTLAVKGVEGYYDVQMPLREEQVLDHINGRRFCFHGEQLVRAGDFWIASALRSTPTATSATVIAHARTNRLLYQATTEAQGHGAVLIP